MDTDKQKLVDICFDLVLTCTSGSFGERFKDKSLDEKCAWVAEQLKECGFETVPVGASWGRLKEN